MKVTIEGDAKRVTVQAAAAIMKKSVQFVRCGLATGKLPFGAAIKFNKRTSYYISPKKFMEFTGCTAEDLDAALNGGG